MAVTAVTYGQFLKCALNKEVNLLSDDIKVMLCTSAYAPNKDTHVYKSSVTNEVSATGTNYTTGGASLTSKQLTYDAATDTVNFIAATQVWAASTITARFAVIYDNTPSTDATKPLVGYVDFGVDFISSNSNFTLAWDTLGVAGFAAL